MKKILLLLFTLAFGTVTDIDGNVYETVQIGNQLWMKENLKVTHYNNGDPISTNYSDNEWDNLNEAAYSIYEENTSYGEQYGFLYNWWVGIDEREVCPEGFDMPSNQDWLNLIDYLGGADIAGGKMKKEGVDDWNHPNLGATNSSGFSSLPAGVRHSNSGLDCEYINEMASYWSTDEASINNSNAMVSNIFFDQESILNQGTGKGWGGSIRCIADSIIQGCTDSESLNYDETANVNAGCLYLGDINGDLTVDIADVVTLVAYVVQNEANYNLETIQTTGEINNDGIINVIDVVLLVNIIVNQ